MSTPPGANDTPELSPAVMAALTGGRVIDAIKMVRAERGIGLKEAKETVDHYLAAHPAMKRRIDAQQAESLRGCLLWLAGLFALASVALLIIAGKK